MTTYMYTIHKQYRSESDSSHRNDLLKSDHDSLLVDILAIVCRANYIISQKNGYDLPSWVWRIIEYTVDPGEMSIKVKYY